MSRSSSILNSGGREDSNHRFRPGHYYYCPPAGCSCISMIPNGEREGLGWETGWPSTSWLSCPSDERTEGRRGGARERSRRSSRSPSRYLLWSAGPVHPPFSRPECDRADQTTRPAPEARFRSQSSSRERERESERSRYALTASHWDGDCRRRLLIRPIWYELLVLHPPPPPSAPTRLLLPYLLLLLLDPENTKKSRRRRRRNP